MIRRAIFFNLMLVTLAICMSLFFISNTVSAHEKINKLGSRAKTCYGIVEGTEDQNNTWTWKGIPFAKPPVGELRWQAPQDPLPWEGIKNTTKYQSPCIQYSTNDKGEQIIIGSEDCLYLNIWRPQTQKRNLPVYLWIHGGGNSMGSAEEYPGDLIAQNGNMVVVTIQYRLGPFGWFTHPDLRNGKNLLNDSGNFGTLDIIKSLEWVKKNIKAFGGNPDNVMIAGESAGGMNVFTMILSKPANGLFDKAMSQSGGFWTTTMEDGDKEAKIIVDRLLEKDGLSDIPENNIELYLKEKSPEELMGVFEADPSSGMIKSVGANTNALGIRLGGYLDGYVLPKEGIYALNNPNTYNQVPIIAGANKEETKLFTANSFATWKPEENGGLSYQEFNILLSNDWIKTAVDIPLAMMTSNKSQPPAYAYQLNYGAYNEGSYNPWSNETLAIIFGASHTVDLPLFFGKFPFFPFLSDMYREDNSAGYKDLSKSMMNYVATFAHTGKPFNIGSVKWEQWSSIEGKENKIIFNANDKEALIEMARN